MKKSTKWEVAAIAILVVTGSVVSDKVSGWQYWLIGGLVIAYGACRKRAGIYS